MCCDGRNIVFSDSVKGIGALQTAIPNFICDGLVRVDIFQTKPAGNLNLQNEAIVKLTAYWVDILTTTFQLLK